MGGLQGQGVRSVRDNEFSAARTAFVTEPGR
jgi:hypothetical protein